MPQAKTKPDKPSSDFPLFPHATGRWAKKIKGRTCYFGPWDDPRAAVALYEAERRYWERGEYPPDDLDAQGNRLTVGDLCNLFLEHKDSLVKSNDLEPITLLGYIRTCRAMVKDAHQGGFGRDTVVADLRPGDFDHFRVALLKRFRSPRSLAQAITNVRMVFKFAAPTEYGGHGLIEKPVPFGQAFKQPSKKRLRQHRNLVGERLFEAHECRRILDALAGLEVVVPKVDEETGESKVKLLRPDRQMRAMVLLGLNAGFGPTDIANLPKSAINLGSGWINFPRRKTEIQRRVPLWPETVHAIREALQVRPEAANPVDGNLCFLTRNGRRWVRVNEKQDGEPQSANWLAGRFRQLLRKLRINDRPGLVFYTFRHTFQTIGGDSKDPDAVSFLMGHADNSMADHYRERISDERLRAVVAVVHDWLWPAKPKVPSKRTRAKPRGRALRGVDTR